MMRTIGDWRQAIRERLRPIAGDQAAAEADRLIGEVAGAGPTELTLRHQETLPAGTVNRLQDLVADRLRGRPLAYVIGHVEFCGLELLCDERVLIPRPETEGLVEIARQSLPPFRDGVRPLVVDVGTGSGNIALALAHRRPDLRVIATDVSEAALMLAGQNRARLGLVGRVSLLKGDTLTMFASGCADMVVSNPPYVRPGDPRLDQSVSAHEPGLALYGGPTGIEVLKKVLDQAPSVLRSGGLLICEIGYDQGSAVRAFVDRSPHWRVMALHPDLTGIERVLVVQRR